MSAGIVVYTHVPLGRLAMTREEVEQWVEQLNEQLEGTEFRKAVITHDGTLALDARLARSLDLQTKQRKEA